MVSQERQAELRDMVWDVMKKGYQAVRDKPFVQQVIILRTQAERQLADANEFERAYFEDQLGRALRTGSITPPPRPGGSSS